MKKILFILNDLGSGGSEKVFVNLANSFVENGIAVDVLLGKKCGIFINHLNPKISVKVLNAKSLISYFITIPFYLKKKYTHVFTETDYISAATIFSKLVRLSSVKVFVTLHYYLPFFLQTIPKKNKTLLKWLNKNIIVKADKIIAVSNGVANGFSLVTGFDEKKIHVIYNPIFDDTIFTQANESIDLPTINNTDCVLISMGNLIFIKDYTTLITAFAIVKKQITNAKLIVLGEGELEGDIKSLVIKLNIQNDVFFLGFVSNPYKYLTKAKVLISSSLSEGFCNAIVEALALGINVVSTNSPTGPSEILENGKYGWLSAVKDEKALANNILDALKNPKERNYLMQRSKIYHKNFILKQYINIL